MSSKSKKIGVFGGTFNPPHAGHVKLADAFAQKLEFDKILIIPANLPPHKDNKDLLSSEDRLEMCKRAFFKPLFEICDLEIKRGGISYTYETLSRIGELYKDAHLYLIVGSDMFLTFHEWKYPELILELCTVCPCVRNDKVQIEHLKDYANKNYADKLDKIKIVLRDFDPIDISSTQIRGMLYRGEQIDKLVPKSVIEYINDRGLYSDPDNGRV
ncbi:MAG: nicotinate (nicotinamide) nucleotide adenylyltransferase [Oscillospiraceae bacterium]|nr:nicotinate (nicotinamide) nucleotide adenylyltransferase [Oscillospiraceae bacterium]